MSKKELDNRIEAVALEASDVAFLSPASVEAAEGPVRAPEAAPARLGYRAAKRAFDVAFSLCAIAALLVPSLLLCLAIRLESPGCPIYSQKRVGRVGRNGELATFSMYKFRSMHAGADARLAELQELNEADGPLFKIKDDPRVTRIIETNARRALSALVFASVFPPKSTVVSVMFPQVNARIKHPAEIAGKYFGRKIICCKVAQNRPIFQKPCKTYFRPFEGLE